MNPHNLFSKLNGTPAQILIILGLGLTLLVPVWQHYKETGLMKANARFDQTLQMVKMDVEEFKKVQSAELKNLYEDTALAPQARTDKVEQLRKAANAKMADLQNTYDDTPLRRDWLSAQASVIDTQWQDLLGWLGRLLLLLGLIALTLQSEGLRQKTLLIVLLVVLLGSLASMNPDLSTALLGQAGMTGQSVNSMIGTPPPVSQEISQEIDKLLENLPPPPAPPPPPGTSLINPGDIGIPGGVPGGVVGGILGGVTSKPAPAFPAPREIPKSPPQVRVSGSVQQTNLISRVNPVYPPLAKAARIQGTVILEALISREGTVQKVTVLSGHPLLVQAAVDAVRQWLYRPLLLNGEPVEVLTTITVNFVLQ